MSGKGSERRPCFVPEDEVARRWEETFGRRERGQETDHGDGPRTHAGHGAPAAKGEG